MRTPFYHELTTPESGTEPTTAPQTPVDTPDATSAPEASHRGRNMAMWWAGWFLIGAGLLLFVASLLRH